MISQKCIYRIQIIKVGKTINTINNNKINRISRMEINKQHTRVCVPHLVGHQTGGGGWL